MAADPQQEPAYDASGGPQAVEGPQVDPAAQAAPDPAQGAVAPPEEPGPHDDVLQQVKAATEAAAINALAFGTGDPEQIDVQSLDMAMGAVLKGCQAIALLDPAAKPLAPADELRGRLDANKALLQDHQHAEQMRVQEETARQREGRPQGPAKP